jgi:hypothetical protein
MAQPQWRRRQWTRGRTAEDRRMHELVSTAMQRQIKLLIDGLHRRPIA